MNKQVTQDRAVRRLPQWRIEPINESKLSPRKREQTGIHFKRAEQTEMFVNLCRQCFLRFAQKTELMSNVWWCLHEMFWQLCKNCRAEVQRGQWPDWWPAGGNSCPLLLLQPVSDTSFEAVHIYLRTFYPISIVDIGVKLIEKIWMSILMVESVTTWWKFHQFLLWWICLGMLAIGEISMYLTSPPAKRVSERKPAWKAQKMQQLHGSNICSDPEWLSGSVKKVVVPGNIRSSSGR